MKNKTLLIITILFLAIGFAAVSTTLILNGTIKVGTNNEDFDVYFSNAIIDGIEDLSLISQDKKTINFETKDLIKVGDKSILEYEVTNASTQYDANVSVTCTPKETELYKVINTQDKEIIEARSIGNGTVTVELKKNVLEEQTINFTCTITASALERETSNDVALPIDDTYVLEGTYVDSTGKTISNANLVVYSDTPHYATTDANGNLLVSNLERGSHEIYHINDTLENIKNMSKEEIISKATTSASFYTSSKIITFENNSSISSTILPNKEYCSSIVGKVYEFDYTGGEQEFTTICDGEYKLETWGAQGGSYNSTYRGGFGAYSKGDILISQNTLMYINVGGTAGCISQTTPPQSEKPVVNGGYNGGGDSKPFTRTSWSEGYVCAGGGATHIAAIPGVLKKLKDEISHIYIISAGGGGAAHAQTSLGFYAIGGNGGGITGGAPTLLSGDTGYSNFSVSYTLATQTSPGKFSFAGITYNEAGFGYGASTYCAGGGGGGLYGSEGAIYTGGGSSYIGNPVLTNKAMYCFNCTESSEELTFTKKTTQYSLQPEANKAKQGNGYAKITYLG